MNVYLNVISKKMFSILMLFLLLNSSFSMRQLQQEQYPPTIPILPFVTVPPYPSLPPPSPIQSYPPTINSSPPSIPVSPSVILPPYPSLPIQSYPPTINSSPPSIPVSLSVTAPPYPSLPPPYPIQSYPPTINLSPPSIPLSLPYPPPSMPTYPSPSPECETFSLQVTNSTCDVYNLENPTTYIFDIALNFISKIFTSSSSCINVYTYSKLSSYQDIVYYVQKISIYKEINTVIIPSNISQNMCLR